MSSYGTMFNGSVVEVHEVQVVVVVMVFHDIIERRGRRARKVQLPF